MRSPESRQRRQPAPVLGARRRPMSEPEDFLSDILPRQVEAEEAIRHVPGLRRLVNDIVVADMPSVLGFEPPLGHITTFGGHPVSCAAGLATLRFLTENKAWETVGEKEALFRHLLVHPAIQEVRSAGLLMAVEVGEFSLLRKIIADCVANGVITDWFLFNDRSLRIAPPLTISEGEIRMACEVIVAAIDKFTSS